MKFWQKQTQMPPLTDHFIDATLLRLEVRQARDYHLHMVHRPFSEHKAVYSSEVRFCLCLWDVTQHNSVGSVSVSRLIIGVLILVVTFVVQMT